MTPKHHSSRNSQNPSYRPSPAPLSPLNWGPGQRQSSRRFLPSPRLGLAHPRMSQLEFLDILGSQPWYQELSGGRNAWNAARYTPPNPGQVYGEVGKVNDTMFVKGLGRQVHMNTRTKNDSFLRSAGTVSHPSHARPRSRPRCSSERLQ